MERKAQSQVITTILIILLVLAVIVIVWQVVTRTVTESGEILTAKSACLGVTLELKDVSCVDGVVDATVTRGADSAGDIEMKYVLGDSASTPQDGPISLGSVLISIAGGGTDGMLLRIAPIVGDQTCDPTDEVELDCT